MINRTSVRCVLPDMSTLLCDGPVLVEAGLQVGGPYPNPNPKPKPNP